MRTSFSIVLLALVTSASASTPGRYSEGLAAHTTVNTRDGEVAVLRATPSGRVHVPGATFLMGSSLAEMAYAIELCKREPLGTVALQLEDVTGLGTVQTRSVHCDVLRFEGEGLFGTAYTTRPVTVSSFSIDRTEVRVDDYMRCVAGGTCRAPGFAPSDARFARPNFPVVLVSWDDARDYCTFARGRLPTEAEWELAARGPTSRIFPWGNLYNSHLSNHGSLALDPTDATDGFAGLAPVGSIADGRTPLGLLDMAGNAAEWVADAIDPIEGLVSGRPMSLVPPYCPREGERMETYGHCCFAPQTWSDEHKRCEGCFPKQKWSDVEHTCKGAPECPSGMIASPPPPATADTCVPLPATATRVNPISKDGRMRIVRGGSYLQGADQQRAASRDKRFPANRYPDLGFRCASDD